MKKIILSVLATAALAIAPAMADDVPITVEKLPAKAQEFLKANFAKNSVVSAMHDRDFTDNDYTVYLDNGVKVEFDGSGKWDSIKGAVPSAVIPAKIKNYLSQHYASFNVVKIDRKRYGYEVELNNDLELKFDVNGNFLGLDD